MQLAIVDEQAMAGLHRFEDLRMRKIDAAAVAGHVAVVEREGLADLELDLAFGKLSDAQLRPLQIGEDAIGRPQRASTTRIRSISVRMTSWLAWLMLIRNRSAPASCSF